MGLNGKTRRSCFLGFTNENDQLLSHNGSCLRKFAETLAHGLPQQDINSRIYGRQAVHRELQIAGPGTSSYCNQHRGGTHQQ